MKDYCRVAEKVVPARAYENEIYIAYVNRCGVEGDTLYCGRSCLVGPDGRDIVRAGMSEELMTADVNRQAITRARKINPVLNDRRSELYAKPVKLV